MELMNGISVIVCCYNSAWIIERCLNALLAQQVPSYVLCEIIVVNNASTDDTERIANKVLQKGHISYQLINEPKAGLLNARKCGIRAARYSYTIFCDDDNVLCDIYVSTMYDQMEKDSGLGACGGLGIAEFQMASHPYVKKYIASYAIGSQLDNVKANFLYGAGICVRTLLLRKIYSNYDLLLTGRCGNLLLSGDDSEMTKLMVLENYRLSYTDDAKFYHVLPSKRLTCKYLINMFKGFGLAYPILKAYDIALNGKNPFVYILFMYINILFNLLFNILFAVIKRKRVIWIFFWINAAKGLCYWGWNKLYYLSKSLKKY